MHAIILGLVEGITEYLPISSTGHLILVRNAMGLDKATTDAFLIVIQGGAILAVLGLYRQRVGQMIAGLRGRNAAGLRLAVNLFVAFLPAAILGPILHDPIEEHLFNNVAVVIALAVGGLVMIVLGPCQRRFYDGDHHRFIDIEHLTWKRALLIGVIQCLAMWPGTSRSMVTIIGGMLVGMRPRQAAEFSFLLGLPTLGGAMVYSGAKSFTGDDGNPITDLGWMPLVVGLVVATASAALAVKWLVGYLNRHGLAVFGWYRLVLAVLFVFFVFFGEHLRHQVAVAGTDRLAHGGAENVPKLPDHLVTVAGVVLLGDDRLELDERSEALHLVEVDSHILQHP
ncbi:MAG: undecaprenyl-diphosphate phosphatase, partial [Planctomycetota bacterium]